MFAQSPFTAIDVTAQGSYVTACYELKEYDTVTYSYHGMAAPQDQDALHAMLAYYAQNDRPKATSVAIQRLEAQPYNTAFLKSALKLTRLHGIDATQNARFNAAVRNTQQLAAQYENGST
jgi:hypothetical protein